MSNLLIRNIRCLVGAEKTARRLARGKEMSELPQLENAWLLCENGKVSAFGTMENCPPRADEIVDATGKFVLPSFCDSHTHLVFAATREEEFVDRIRGLSYEEIARRGGGILNSARKLREMPEEKLLDDALARLHEVIRFGTGAIEIKSGYGLSLESELKMLRVVRRLREVSPIPIRATFLGAHAVPAEFRDGREQYLKILLEKMLPQVAAEGLADYCDVFCDRGFFTVEETDRILKAASKFGLKPKIHANELANSGGVQIGVANGAVSVDHLEEIDEPEIECLKNSSTLPTALPLCAFFLGIPFAPGRRMIDAGLPLVLASDFNPGTAPAGRMSLVVSLACIKMKLLPEEAITAATLNGAAALEWSDEMGSLAVGKRANFFITRPMSNLAFLPYYFGSDWVERVFVGGRQM